MKEKLKKLGYRISICENSMTGCRDLNDLWIDIFIYDGKIKDYAVIGSSTVRSQSDINNLQIAYDMLKSDLRELGKWKLMKK